MASRSYHVNIYQHLLCTVRQKPQLRQKKSSKCRLPRFRHVYNRPESSADNKTVQCSLTIVSTSRYMVTGSGGLIRAPRTYARLAATADLKPLPKGCDLEGEGMMLGPCIRSPSKMPRSSPRVWESWREADLGRGRVSFVAWSAV